MPSISLSCATRYLFRPSIAKSIVGPVVRRILLIVLALIFLTLTSPQPTTAQTDDIPFVLIWSSTESDFTNDVAWGDYDGDGDLDLAVGSYYTNRLYRNDDGILTASAVWSSDETDHTTSVAWGDFDGDGDLDLAVGNSGSTEGQPNRLYRNDDGILTTSAVWSSDEADHTTSVAWGDYDGDGDLDWAVGNSSSTEGQPNRLYRNDGGALTTNAIWSSGEISSTESIAWGDYDADGDLDLAVGNGTEPSCLYRNDGGALTTNAAWSPTDSNGFSVAWGDYDSDGDLDLAVGTWLYRNDSGTLTDSAVWSPDEAEPGTDVAWGDYDSDGDLDLAVGGLNRPNLLYRNDGGVLTRSAIWSTHESDQTQSVAWGDYDGDGDLDLAVGNLEQPNRLYLNEGSGLTTSPVWISDEADNNRGIAWGDYDDDGDLDLAVGNWDQPNRLYNNDGGMLTTNVVWSSDEADSTHSIAWGDYDGDGDLDLAAGNAGDPNRLYRNDGGMLSTSAVWSSDESDSTFSIAWGDCDGDGDLDLAVGNDGQPDRLYRNGGGILTASAVWSSDEAEPSTSVAWGDYDGDGDLDLVVGSGFRPNRLYRNDGGALTTSTVWLPDETDFTYSVAWGDYDGDGDIDLAVGNMFHPNRLYRNDEGLLTPNPVWSSTDGGGIEVVWGDYDGDGDLDLAVGGDTGPDRLYRNDGGELTTSAVWTSNTSHVAWSAAWGDYDGDGDLDLAVGSGGPDRAYCNLRRGNVSLINDPPYVEIFRPGATDDADFFSTPHIIRAANIPITYTLFDPEGDAVAAIFPEFSPSGGGQWFPATPATGTITTDLSTCLPEHHASGNTFPITISAASNAVSSTLIVPGAAMITDLDVWLNIDHTWDEDLDVHLESPNGTLVELFTDVGGSEDNFTDTVLDDEATTPITSGVAPFTGRFQPEGSLADFDGEMANGFWTLWVVDDYPDADDGAVLSWGLNLQAGDGTHVFIWNAEADLVKSDNVVFRIRAQPGYTHSPILWPAVDGKSPSFRVEAAPWFIKTVDDSGNAAAGTAVYYDGQPVTCTVSGLSITNQAGLLNPGPLELSKPLVALSLPLYERPTARDDHDDWAYRVCLTSLDLDDDGIPHPYIVTGPGQQLLTLQKDKPLVLFNIVVSVEWDADEENLATIADAFHKASDYLYDVTDGQMAFGQVTIYDKAQYWADADFQISTKNTVHPYAFIGGITSDDTAHSIRVGRFWTRKSGNEGDWNEPDGYRTLIHEFGHYGLYLYDEYFVRLLNADGHFTGQASAACTGVDVVINDGDATNASLMYYQYNASELVDSDRWTVNCRNTEQARVNREPDWQTVVTHYGGTEWELNTPSGRGSVMAGPDAFPSDLLPFPVVEVHNEGPGGLPCRLTVLGSDSNPFPNALVALYTTPYSYTVAIDQGLTGQDGQLMIYGALERDTIQAASFDGAYAGAVAVDGQSAYTLTLSPTSAGRLAARAGGSSPYLNLIPGSEGDTLLLKLHGAPSGSLPLSAVVIPGEGGGSPQSTSLAYSPGEDAYVGQVSFAGVGLGTGEVRVSGVAGAQWVSINSDYNMLRALDGQANDLASEDGNFQLHVDAGSLLNHTDAYAVVLPTGYVPGPLPPGMRVLGSAYEIRFSGAATGLEKPGLLAMYYHPEVMGMARELAIYHWNAVAGGWEWVGAERIELDNSVAAPVEQLGIYALMGGEPLRVFLPVALRQ